MKIDIPNPEEMGRHLRIILGQAGWYAHVIDNDERNQHARPIWSLMELLERGEAGDRRRIRCMSEHSHEGHIWFMTDESGGVRRASENVWCEGVFRNEPKKPQTDICVFCNREIAKGERNWFHTANAHPTCIIRSQWANTVATPESEHMPRPRATAKCANCGQRLYRNVQFRESNLYVIGEWTHDQVFGPVRCFPKNRKNHYTATPLSEPSVPQPIHR
jgi:hypothetical protein